MPSLPGLETAPQATLGQVNVEGGGGSEAAARGHKRVMGRLLKVCMWEMTGVGNIPSPCGVSEWEDLLQLREEDPSAVPGGLGSGKWGSGLQILDMEVARDCLLATWGADVAVTSPATSQACREVHRLPASLP